jgi:NAD(P)-dependent dehydrogenase (short-subunit alcohol dehydrogenase family)
VSDLTGKLAVITGAADGTGLVLSHRLAAAGADVVLAVPEPDHGEDAMFRILNLVPGANSCSVRVKRLDLASLASVAAFTQELADEGRPVDFLINNATAGVTPERLHTEDGYELHFGANYLGHFALTGRLLPLLRARAGARVVTMGSMAARTARIDFGDVQGERCRPFRAYAASKLAQLIFALELDRRSRQCGWEIRSNAAHTGGSVSGLSVARSPGPAAALSRALARIPGLGRGVADAATPALFAAMSDAAAGGAYYGPGGFAELTGMPAKARIPRGARDLSAAGALWRTAEDLTGVAYPTGYAPSRLAWPASAFDLTLPMLWGWPDANGYWT